MQFCPIRGTLTFLVTKRETPGIPGISFVLTAGRLRSFCRYSRLSFIHSFDFIKCNCACYYARLLYAQFYDSYFILLLVLSDTHTHRTFRCTDLSTPPSDTLCFFPLLLFVTHCFRQGWQPKHRLGILIFKKTASF